MIGLFILQKGAIRKVILAHGIERVVIEVFRKMSEVAEELVLLLRQPTQLILLGEIPPPPLIQISIIKFGQVSFVPFLVQTRVTQDEPPLG